MSRIHCQHARTYRAAGKSAWLELCETCGEIVAAGTFEVSQARSEASLSGDKLREAIERLKAKLSSEPLPQMERKSFKVNGWTVEWYGVIDSGPKPSDVVDALLRSVPGVKP